jgi:hypothetical protein
MLLLSPNSFGAVNLLLENTLSACTGLSLAQWTQPLSESQYFCMA